MTRLRKAGADRHDSTQRGLTLDTGALLAVEAGQEGEWRPRIKARARYRRYVVPAVVLAQAWRGGPQARLSHLLSESRIEAFDEDAARRTGVALAQSGTRDIVDAAVVASALVREDKIVTSDPGDLRRIAAALGRSIDLLGPKRAAVPAEPLAA